MILTAIIAVEFSVWFYKLKLLELPWSLELYTQANCRLHRMGQGESVIIHHIVCEGTLDEKVLLAPEKKNQVQKGLLDALKEYVEEVIP